MNILFSSNIRSVKPTEIGQYGIYGLKIAMTLLKSNTTCLVYDVTKDDGFYVTGTANNTTFQITYNDFSYGIKRIESFVEKIETNKTVNDITHTRLYLNNEIRSVLGFKNKVLYKVVGDQLNCIDKLPINKSKDYLVIAKDVFTDIIRNVELTDSEIRHIRKHNPSLVEYLGPNNFELESQTGRVLRWLNYNKNNLDYLKIEENKYKIESFVHKSGVLYISSQFSRFATPIMIAEFIKDIIIVLKDGTIQKLDEIK